VVKLLTIGAIQVHFLSFPVEWDSLILGGNELETVGPAAGVWINEWPKATRRGGENGGPRKFPNGGPFRVTGGWNPPVESRGTAAVGGLGTKALIGLGTKSPESEVK